MINGLDTTFLVCAEVREHPRHQAARTLLDTMLEEGTQLGLAPQILSEFVHVVTDPRRFERPLEVSMAVGRAQQWWEAKEIVGIQPSDESTKLFLRWMTQHRLGRKRLLDTQLAATYHAAGIRTIVSTNPRDFKLFDDISVLEP